MPKVAVSFAGPSYFGGKDDQLILCAGKGTLEVHKLRTGINGQHSW